MPHKLYQSGFVISLILLPLISSHHLILLLTSSPCFQIWSLVTSSFLISYLICTFIVSNVIPAFIIFYCHSNLMWSHLVSSSNVVFLFHYLSSHKSPSHSLGGWQSSLFLRNRLVVTFWHLWCRWLKPDPAWLRNSTTVLVRAKCLQISFELPWRKYTQVVCVYVVREVWLCDSAQFNVACKHTTIVLVVWWVLLSFTHFICLCLL